MRSENLESTAASGTDYYIENYRQAEPWLQNLATKAGFTTIALVDKKGQLIYSTAKHSLGALSGDGLRGALDLSVSREEPVMTGFSTPVGGEDSAAYIAVPIPAPAGRSSSQRAGTLIVGIGTETLDLILHDTNGFGPAG